jgi:DNA-binding transcriptional regulator YiaG
MIATPEQFAAARHTLGLSISQCARLVNVAERTIRRWETMGDRDPHPSACRILDLCIYRPALITEIMRLDQ